MMKEQYMRSANSKAFKYLYCHKVVGGGQLYRMGKKQK